MEIPRHTNSESLLPQKRRSFNGGDPHAVLVPCTPLCAPEIHLNLILQKNRSVGRNLLPGLANGTPVGFAKQFLYLWMAASLPASALACAVLRGQVTYPVLGSGNGYLRLSYSLFISDRHQPTHHTLTPCLALLRHKDFCSPFFWNSTTL